MLEDDEQFNVELKRFERMMEKNASDYFEAGSLEDIIDHYIVKNKIKKATFAVNFALKLYPGIVFFELRRAQLFSTGGHLKESLLILQDLEKIEPGNAEVFLSIASIFSQLRDHPKSIKYFEKALEIEKLNGDFGVESFDIMLDLALEYENNNDFPGAINVLEQILAVAPDNESAIYEIAFCYERLGEFDKCISFYERYINNHPYSFTAWYNLGNIYFLKKNIEKALWAYDYAIIINENFSSAYFNMGNTLMQIDEYDQAIAAYKKCLEIDPEDDLALCYLGEAMERKGNLEEALIYYEKAIIFNPELADAYIGIGIVKDLLGKTNLSVSYFQKAIQLQPKNDNFHHVLGEALYKLDRLAESELELEKALQLNSKSSDSVELLAKIKYTYNPYEAIDFLDQYEIKESLTISAAMYKIKLLWEVGQHTEALARFKQHLINHYDESIEKIDLHFPENKLIKHFITLIQQYAK